MTPIFFKGPPQHPIGRHGTVISSVSVTTPLPDLIHRPDFRILVYRLEKKESMTMAKGQSRNIHLKYSLLSDEFRSTIGKRRAQRLREAISSWTGDKNQEQLVETYIDSLAAYWKKTGLAGVDRNQARDGYRLTVDLVYKKGRKPNTVRIEDNPRLKEELRQLAAR
jgi:hypothetical protein